MSKVVFMRWLPLTLMASVLVAALIIGRQSGITIPVALRWLYLTIKDAPWLVLLLFFLRPPFILPISWLVLLCGMLWGLVAGGACAVAGMLLSATSSYALARYVLPASSGMAPSASKLGVWLERLRREGFMSVVLMRLMLLPFDVVNFAAAGLRVNFRSYFMATVLGNTVATLIYASVGASIHLEAFLNDAQMPALGEVLDRRQLLLTLVVLAASLLFARYFKQRNGSRTR